MTATLEPHPGSGTFSASATSASRRLYKQALSDLVAFYRETGYVVLRDAFARDEIARWQAECDRLVADRDLVHPDNLRTPFRKGATFPGPPERIDPAIDVSPVFRALAHDERIAAVLAAIFDGHPPAVWKDKLIFKAPGVQGYDIHQDGSWWQGLDVPAGDLLSVMIAIDGADAANGGLELFPGYHRALLSTPGETRNMTAAESRVVDRSRGRVIETQPGDVIVFHALAPHQSGPNTSDRGRRQFYLTYSNGRHGDRYARQQAHYRAYTERGLKDEERGRKYWR